jgi:DNA (cytosine-5)-methyltransferase 1
MKHGSLFSGIGGFDLAAEWMGWENVFHCEWNEFGQKVLHHYWPNAETFTDITKSDFTKYANKIDILTGGFPCQPYSSAGQRKGKEDERHLWPEMLRAIREIKPKYIVGENVFGLLNWNGGMVFDEVHSDLESEGYAVQAVVIPAAAVNAPHGRDRVWFVATNTKGIINEEQSGKNSKWRNRFIGNNGPNRDATNSNSIRTQTRKINTILGEQNQQRKTGRFVDDVIQRDVANSNSDGFHECNNNDEINTSEGRFDAQCNTNTGNVDGDVTDSNSGGLEGTKEVRRNGINVERESEFGIATNTRSIGLQCEGESTQLERGRFSFDNTQNNKTTWDNFPTESPICGGDDGLPTQLDGITFSKWRNESIKAYGNAIVPQVAYEIFKAIQRTI